MNCVADIISDPPDDLLLIMPSPRPYPPKHSSDSVIVSSAPSSTIVAYSSVLLTQANALLLHLKMYDSSLDKNLYTIQASKSLFAEENLLCQWIVSSY